MFKAFTKTIKFIFDVIVFGFFKEAISKVIPDKRLRAIISQNPSLKSSLYKIRVLKRPQTKSIKTIIFRFSNLKVINKAINLGVFFKNLVS
jgi:hypothetical protein